MKKHMRVSFQIQYSDVRNFLYPLLYCHLLGCLTGSLLRLLWCSRAFLWHEWSMWMTGEKVRYITLFIRSIRFPMLMLFCRMSRKKTKWTAALLWLYGASLAYEVTDIIKTYGYRGAFLSIPMLFTPLISSPLLLLLANENCAIRRTAAINRTWFIELSLIVIACAAMTGVEFVLSPFVLSILLWIK